MVSQGESPLTERFVDALQFTFEIHKPQIRKGTGVPYISHLMAVTAMVLENGGTEDQAIAALLHDAVEDQGGLKTLLEIRRRYGVLVADLVSDLSDSASDPKPPWRMRKEAYINHLPNANPKSHLISISDKLHNARSLITDYQREGDSIWLRFNAPKKEILWYYSTLVDYFSEHASGPLVEELEKAVSQLRVCILGSD